MTLANTCFSIQSLDRRRVAFALAGQFDRQPGRIILRDHFVRYGCSHAGNTKAHVVLYSCWPALKSLGRLFGRSLALRFPAARGRCRREQRCPRAAQYPRQLLASALSVANHLAVVHFPTFGDGWRHDCTA